MVHLCTESSNLLPILKSYKCSRIWHATKFLLYQGPPWTLFFFCSAFSCSENQLHQFLFTNFFPHLIHWKLYIFTSTSVLCKEGSICRIVLISLKKEVWCLMGRDTSGGRMDYIQYVQSTAYNVSSDTDLTRLNVFRLIRIHINLYIVPCSNKCGSKYNHGNVTKGEGGHGPECGGGPPSPSFFPAVLKSRASSRASWSSSGEGGSCSWPGEWVGQRGTWPAQLRLGPAEPNPAESHLPAMAAAPLRSAAAAGWRTCRRAGRGSIPHGFLLLLQLDPPRMPRAFTNSATAMPGLAWSSFFPILHHRDNGWRAFKGGRAASTRAGTQLAGLLLLYTNI